MAVKTALKTPKCFAHVRHYHIIYYQHRAPKFSYEHEEGALD